ncbi:MAG TPA: type II toxin-antitoxin system HicA family toxin [Chitinophagaceae bacterium]|jgi:predicted RNA binding protein YcfA (HicA-like mRNA interferase family)|nr:type II toxin-antitoxin system HicA family toxin [Chitinophagaceae bacterium]
MKVDELIKKVKKGGWVEERQSGSHKIFKHANKKETLSIPYHKGKDVPTGTAKAILKKAGIK